MSNTTISEIIEPKFRELLNEQNLDLWKELAYIFTIILEEAPEKNFLTYFNGQSVIIEVDMDDLSPASFTHELLHVYMKSVGVEIAWDLKEIILEDKDLLELFSTSLRVHIGNCLEHVKMLPLYLSRGFRNEDFIGDYSKKIMDEERMLELEHDYRICGRPDLARVDTYIDIFFSMKASNNAGFAYTSYFERLENLDPSLYNIHQDFWRGWRRFKVGDAKQNLMFLNTYLSQLKIWKRRFL